MSIRFITLYCGDIHITKKFYEDHFSLYFHEERHGSGPVHFSAEIGSVLLELYPSLNGQISRITFGISEKSDSLFQNRISDPDGNIIFF